jgi:GT2 family glycosyltransferase
MSMNRQESNPILSIIIVTWNGKKYALECIESLHQNESAVSAEIIVVDNGSSDGTPAAIRHRFPSVKVIENHSNLGFAKANNIGMAWSRGQYVCLVNSDVVVPAGCLEKMIEFMEANPDVGVLGPKMLSPGGGIGASVMRFPTIWNTFCSALALHRIAPHSPVLGGFEMAGYPYNTIDDVEVLTGWFWMVPRVALQEVGGLDERFFMYGEDIDWCKRFRQADWRAVFFPKAEALHYGAASSGEAPTRFYVEMRRANLQYFQKHHGQIGALGYRLAIAIHELVRLGAYSLVYPFSQRRRAEAVVKANRSISSLRWLLGDKSWISIPRTI